jgi:hypothetical protein
LIHCITFTIHLISHAQYHDGRRLDNLLHSRVTIPIMRSATGTTEHTAQNMYKQHLDNITILLTHLCQRINHLEANKKSDIQAPIASMPQDQDAILDNPLPPPLSFQDKTHIFPKPRITCFLPTPGIPTALQPHGIAFHETFNKLGPTYTVPEPFLPPPLIDMNDVHTYAAMVQRPPPTLPPQQPHNLWNQYQHQPTIQQPQKQRQVQQLPQQPHNRKEMQYNGNMHPKQQQQNHKSAPYIRDPIPDQHFSIFQKIRSYCNNRHSYRLFLQDIEGNNGKHSRQEQRFMYIKQIIAGQRLWLDSGYQATQTKHKIHNNLASCFMDMEKYHEQSFLTQDNLLKKDIQTLLCPLNLTEIEALQRPITTHTVKSLDKRRMGRNYRNMIIQEIKDILYGQPVPLRSLHEVTLENIQTKTTNYSNSAQQQQPSQQHNYHLHTTLNELPYKEACSTPLHYQSLRGRSEPSSRPPSPILTRVPSQQSSPNKSTSSSSSHTIRKITLSKSNTSSSTSLDAIFNPEDWCNTDSNINTTTKHFPTTTSAHIHTRTTPHMPMSPTLSESNLEYMVPPSQPTSPSFDNSPLNNLCHIHEETVTVRDDASQDSNSSEQRIQSNTTTQSSTENKIQSITEAIINLKHYTTNIATFNMASDTLHPATNPYKFKCKENFGPDLIRHLKTFSEHVEGPLLITLTNTNNVSLDSIHTHILIQPTPPSQFFTNISRINTFFECIRTINKPIILECLFLSNPPANFLWHHIYKNLRNKIPLIISTTPDLLPQISTSHLNINTSRTTDPDLLLLQSITKKTHFLKPCNHFLSMATTDTSGE